jgi:hypothetical protein
VETELWCLDCDTAKRKGRQQLRGTYRHRATSRLHQTLHQSEAAPSTQTLPPIVDTHDDPLPRELLDHIDRLRLILPVISISVMALNRQDADSDTDIAFVLHEHVCEPLDREIERIETLLASCLWRHQQEGVRQ